MEPTKKVFNLPMHVARLLMDEPFFAVLSREMEKVASEAIPTAGVRITDEGRFEMLYNPSFFADLTDQERKAVLLHEFYHCVLEHVTGRMPGGKMTKLWNYATDLAINSNLTGLPEGCLMPGEGQFVDLPTGKSAEWYHEKLKKDQSPDDDGDDGSGGGGGGGGDGDGEGEPQFDSHEGWEECDEQTKQIARERIKHAMKKAVEECAQTNSWGTVSGGTRQDIIDRLTPKVDWRKVLRYFIKTSQRSNKRSTLKRLNRRYPMIHAGRKTERTAKIAISIDQSGSVDNGMLAAFFSELNKLADLAEFTVIPFDSEVGEDMVYVWKKGERRKTERVMCGGTDFNPPTKYVNERTFDGHIILTDLCAPKPITSKCQRMWMTTKEHAARPYFQTQERIIAIDTAA